MATSDASGQVTAWDETGKPIQSSQATAWDENGKPITPQADPLITGKGMEHPNAPTPVPAGLRPDPLAPLAGKPVQMAGTPPMDQAISDVRQGKIAKPAADLIEKGGEALSPLAAPALVTATLPTIAAAGAGAGAHYLGQKGMESAGATPDQSRLVGDIAGLGVGGAAAEMAPTNQEAGNAIASFARKPGGALRFRPPLHLDFGLADALIPKGELGTPTNPGPTRPFMNRNAIAPPDAEVPEPEPAIIKGPSQSIRESPNFDPEAYKAGRAARIAPPEAEKGAIAAPYGRGGESQIGSNAVERQVQTIVQKNVVTPDEQSFVERNLGPNARMRPGEGITDWRARVTGLMKAARARTK